MPTAFPTQQEEVIPARFQASKTTLFVDRFMTHFIKVGGFIVIAAVLGIFVFILIQIIPLFQGARVKELQTVQLTPGKYSVMGVDEWSQLPFLVRADGKICFADLSAGGKLIEVDPKIAKPASPPPMEGVEAVPLAARRCPANERHTGLCSRLPGKSTRADLWHFGRAVRDRAD